MDFIYKNKLKITMENKTENNSSGFFDVFLSKLKEQSFIIVLMLGVVYFQNKMFTERIANHRETEKQQQIMNGLIIFKLLNLEVGNIG